jgi:hypothetical protein
LQLAELGPEASDILASSLELSSDQISQIEGAARFAAFLASDAFKNEMLVDTSRNEEAYAMILKGTGGDLTAVQDFIKATLNGTGKAAEEAWLVEHPDLPLNIYIKDPSADEIALIEKTLSEKITISPSISMPYGPKGDTAIRRNMQTVTDNNTGASLVVPATLDQKALSTVVKVWQQDQNKSPAELEAILNQQGLSKDLDQWVTNYGAVTIPATIRPLMVPFKVPLTYDPRASDIFRIKGNTPHNGGLISNQPQKLANGGMSGRMSGPGSGTSDSIYTRLSNGEYVNKASSASFWGTDFFDSLNQKMLPTSFLNMLGAASSGGGAERITNVNVVQNNPLTRDPLKQLREDSEMVAAGLW